MAEKVEKEVEVKISDSVSIIIKRTTFQGRKFIDLRKNVKTDRYTGPTRKGIAIPVEVADEVLKKLTELLSEGK